MKIALIADGLTTSCFKVHSHVINITPWNYAWRLRYSKPDLLFVESAWEGHGKRWKYKIAQYPNYPERTNNVLRRVVSTARDLGIPTVFWNKEDGVHFSRFIESAKLFDHILTVDENCIPQYLQATDGRAKVRAMPFPVEPSFHNFSGFDFKIQRANFVGSYNWHIHDRRRAWQDLMFQACTSVGLQIDVYDRNSNRRSPNYRYPAIAGLSINSAIPYAETANIYRQHILSLNVNTVENSPTMYSRRLVEILACGGIALTNPTPSIERYFKDYCYVVSDYYECREHAYRLMKFGPTKRDLERAEAGAEYVKNAHSWSRCIDDLHALVIGKK